MRKLRKSVDSPKHGLESANPSLAQEITSNLPNILNGALSKRNTRHLFTPIVAFIRFILIPFRSWRLLRLIIALLALYVLIQFDSKAQTYQQYPISPTKSYSSKPLSGRAKLDSTIISDYQQEIIWTKGNIPSRAGAKTFNRGIFLKDSRITHISRIGSFYRITANHSRYGASTYLFPDKYDLSFLKWNMLAVDSPSQKRYANQIEANKKRIAAHNQAVRDSLNNRAWYTKIINPE